MVIIPNFKPSDALKIFIVVIILAIFIFFRWYKLQDTLLVYNDMGRDFIALLNWTETNKPPLLGPQTSVVSYNQSAWYFYILYPAFLIMNMSALSSTATLTTLGVITISVILWIFRKSNKYFLPMAIFFLLISVHPQVVLQNRFIWNPSFLPFFLGLNLIAMIQLTNKYSRSWSVSYWLSAAFAVGFSYSALPLVVLTSLVVLIKNKSKLIEHIIIAAVAAAIVLLPLAAFELRHNFSLTKLFLVGQTTPQTASSLGLKTQLLLEYVFPKNPIISSNWLFFLTLIALVAGTYQTVMKILSTKKTFLLLLALLIATTCLLIFLPVNLEKHYIFPVITVLFFCVGFLPKPINIVSGILLAIVWSQPFFINWNTMKPQRSISDMETCYQTFCAQTNKSYYVSMESGIRVGYHNALEHQFSLRKAGCTIYDIEASQDQADSMLVINDAGKFTPGKSGYRELTLFGDYTVGPLTQCSENLSILEIDRPTKSNETQEIFQPQ